MSAAGIVRRRQLRGLIRHALGHTAADRKQTTANPPFYGDRAATPAMQLRINGATACHWCGRPTIKDERGWHSYCREAYILARGRQHHDNGMPIVEQTMTCAECDKSPSANAERRLEIDHIVPLSLARFAGWREFVRAHTHTNFRWLCQPCHSAKTATERAANRANRSPLKI